MGLGDPKSVAKPLSAFDALTQQTLDIYPSNFSNFFQYPTFISLKNPLLQLKSFDYLNFFIGLGGRLDWFLSHYRLQAASAAFDRCVLLDDN
jgi:hypothetical protein